MNLWDPLFDDSNLQATLPELREDFDRTKDAKFKEAVFVFYGLNLVDVPGNGNCFFSALLEQLKKRYPEILARLNLMFSKEVDHMDLRQFTVDSLMREVEQGQLSETTVIEIDNHTTGVAKDGTLADRIVIDILAKALDITVVLISSDGHLPILINGGHGIAVYLGYQAGPHFQSAEGAPNEMMLETIKEMTSHQLNQSNQPSFSQGESDRNDIPSSSSSRIAEDIEQGHSNLITSDLAPLSPSDDPVFSEKAAQDGSQSFSSGADPQTSSSSPLPSNTIESSPLLPESLEPASASSMLRNMPFTMFSTKVEPHNTSETQSSSASLVSTNSSLATVSPPRFWPVPKNRDEDNGKSAKMSFNK